MRKTILLVCLLILLSTGCQPSLATTITIQSPVTGVAIEVAVFEYSWSWGKAKWERQISLFLSRTDIRVIAIEKEWKETVIYYQKETKNGSS